jgi:hypothetical protein
MTPPNYERLAALLDHERWHDPDRPFREASQWHARYRALISTVAPRRYQALVWLAATPSNLDGLLAALEIYLVEHYLEDGKPMRRYRYRFTGPLVDALFAALREAAKEDESRQSKAFAGELKHLPEPTATRLREREHLRLAREFLDALVLKIKLDGPDEHKQEPK